MIYHLSECEWKVKGYYPWVPLKDRSMETGKELQGITDWIDAAVPGGVHYDLYKAGLIPYPYKDMESLKCEWVENRWWLYRTVIHRENIKGRYQSLVLEGIDYQTVIYINGKECCRHEGMYEPIVIDISKEVVSGDDLELKILLMHAPDEMGQIGMTSQTYTQKSRFNYKWDFSTRLVNLGIWKDCYIRVEEEALWESPYLYTDYQQGKGYVHFSAGIRRRGYEAEGCEAVITLIDEKGEVRQTLPITGNQVSGTFVVEDPALWYPNGYGTQELYQIRMELKKGPRLLDSYEQEIGIRSIEYRTNEGSTESALPYTLCINHVPIYVKGVNMTPLDHIYGNVKKEHYEYIVKMMKNMNVNLVRVWGGGLIEKEIFYQLCSRYGIMVWQEFIQSSSGIDNIPSKRPEFLNLLKKTAESAVKSLRSYTSLTVWSGGNELTDEHFVPSGYEDENISMLKQTVELLDPQRIFLPTSASGPREFVTREKGVSHDVHGNWNYMGNPGHYELYADSDSLFHSEFGTEGMCSVRSLNRFLSEEYQTLGPAEHNMAYRHHGEWWCTYERDQKIFGTRKNMDQLVKCSQWMQAEGLRYILESNRRRKFKNSGSIIWQINEPWPNVFCTSLADYYLEPKMAYYWSKKAFSDLSVSLDYRRLDYQPGEKFKGTVYVGKEKPEAQMDYSLEIRVLGMDGNVIFEETCEGAAVCTRTQRAAELEFQLPEDMSDMFAVKLIVWMKEQKMENIYFFSCGNAEPYSHALLLGNGDLEVKVQESGKGVVKARLRNIGTVPLLHIYPYCSEDFDLLCDDSYFTLFPEETKEIIIKYSPKFESGFLNNELTYQSELPKIKFDCFNI